MKKKLTTISVYYEDRMTLDNIKQHRPRRRKGKERHRGEGLWETTPEVFARVMNFYIQYYMIAEEEE